MILVGLDGSAAREDIEMESGSNARLSVHRLDSGAGLEFANPFPMLKLIVKLPD